MKWMLPALLALTAIPSLSQAAVPVFVITPAGSSVTFQVKASVPIAGHFDKWRATLVFTSPDIATGVLEIQVDANSKPKRIILMREDGNSSTSAYEWEAGQLKLAGMRSGPPAKNDPKGEVWIFKRAKE